MASEEYVVDAKIEAPTVVGDDWSEAEVGVDRAETGFFKSPQYIASGYVVEIATYQHVWTAVVTYQAHQGLSLASTLDVGER